MTKVRKAIGTVLILAGIILLIGVLGADDLAMRMHEAVSVKVLVTRLGFCVLCIGGGEIFHK